MKLQFWTKKAIGAEVSPEEKEELAVAQQEAVHLRNQARGLLGIARRAGEDLRESREWNHYGMIAGKMYRGEMP
jgi:hypothetical protein